MAQETEKAYGLTLAVVERVVSKTQGEGLIISQIPEAGSSVEPDGIVQVTVSGGVAYVPRVMGRSLSEARELIAASSLTLNAAITYAETTESSLHGKVTNQSPAADMQVMQGTQVTLTVCRVPDMMHQAKIVLDLPESESLMSVRVTLADDAGEYTVYQQEYPANASRHPEVPLMSVDRGTFTYKVYINNTFKYSNTVTFE